MNHKRTYRLYSEEGLSITLKVDNGPEFAGRMLDQWAQLNGVEIDFSRPGKPTDNVQIEAFNSCLRAEESAAYRSSTSKRSG